MTDSVARLSLALADRYRIERELGQGGMATVYLAHDVRHDRKVALKVLRPELAAILGGERFLKEIRTTANLQHPHILGLHDSGEAEGLIYYVMPYVDGESLRDRLIREKQLPVDEAVRIAREVAGALDYAHRHGVVHRDIKPENILLHEGQALVADFGIALAASRSEGSTRMTETGMSLGTPYYMAPEQAMGEREITPKADIYALGCVLYEMLSAEPPFTGATAQAVVARVMTEQPRPLTLQRHTIPPNIEAAVMTALEKLPADRFATAAEFAAALGNLQFASTATTAMSPAYARPSRAMRMLLAGAGAVTLASLALAGWALARPKPATPVRRYGLALPAAQMPGPSQRFAVSPDGARIVYSGPAAVGTGTQLWVKERDRYEATPISGTANVGNFTLSQDGTWIAYVQAGQVKKLPILGGAAIPLADSAGGNSGIAWLDNGTIVYIGVGNDELRSVPDVGGTSSVLLHADTGLVRFPMALPGSRAILYSRCWGGACRLAQDLWLLELATRRARPIQTGAAMGVYANTGHIIYVRRDGGVLALPFNLRSLAVTGPPVPVLDSVTVVNDVVPLLSLSAEGTLIVRPGAGLVSQLRYEMVWIDRQGRVSPVDSTWLPLRLTQTGGNAGWALSPDGSKLAIGINTDAGDDVWVKQLPNGPLSRVSFDSVADYRPRWSADGRFVIYQSDRNVSPNVYRKRADGTGGEELILDLAPGVYEAAISRDGKWLVARAGGQVNQVGNRDVMVKQIGVDTAMRPLLASAAFDEAAVALSPDGHWIAYETNETGRTEVYVRPFPNADAGKWQVSTNGGVMPVWSRDGRELFYVNGARDMQTVPVQGTGTLLRLGAPRTLFRVPEDVYLPSTENYTVYDVSADGRRFMMARRIRSPGSQASPLIVVENWFEELKQRLGTR